MYDVPQKRAQAASLSLSSFGMPIKLYCPSIRFVLFFFFMCALLRFFSHGNLILAAHLRETRTAHSAHHIMHTQKEITRAREEDFVFFHMLLIDFYLFLLHHIYLFIFTVSCSANLFEQRAHANIM